MLELLKSTGLFDDYSDRELESIYEDLLHEHYYAGEIILNEGGVGDPRDV